MGLGVDLVDPGVVVPLDDLNGAGLVMVPIENKDLKRVSFQLTLPFTCPCYNLREF